MDLIEYFNTVVLPNLNLSRVFSSINPEEKNDRVIGNCPGCGSREAYAYKQGNAAGLLQCNRKNKCGYSIGVFAHLNRGSIPSGQEWVAVLKDLCEMAGVEFPTINFTPEQIERHENISRQQQLFRDFIAITSSLLFDKYGTGTGKDALSYLQKRGWSLEDVKGYGFGFYPNADIIRSELEKHNNKYQFSDIQSSGLHRADWSNRLILPPYKDAKNNITDFQTRAIDDTVPKYSRMHKSHVAESPGLYSLNHIKNKDVIIVEGHFDCLTLHAAGIKDVLALGGNNITSKQTDELIKNQFNSITLFLDNDTAGIEATLKIVQAFINTNIKLFVIPPEAMPEGYDPDRFTKEQGSDAINKLYESRIFGTEYVAQSIIKQYNTSGNWSAPEISETLTAVIKFDEHVSNADQSLDMDRFWQVIAEKTPIQEHTLKHHRQTIQEKREQDELRCHVENINNKATELIKTGNTEEAARLFDKASEKIRSSQPSLTKIQFINELDINFLSTDAPRMPTLVNIFDGVNNLPFIRRGVVSMLAGIGGIGKTHWLTQLALCISTGHNFLGQYPIEESGHVFMVLGEDAEADVHRMLRKNFKALFPTQDLALTKRASSSLAIMSVHGKDATLLNKDGFPTKFYHDLLNELKRKEPISGWKLIILDPASRFLGAEAETDNASATRFITLLERITLELKGNPTVFFGHHMKKSALNKQKSGNQTEENQETNQSDARGSSALVDGARLVINLIKSPPCESNEIKMVMVKSNHTVIYEPQIISKDNNGCLLIKEIANGSDFKTVPAQKTNFNDKGNKQKKRSVADELARL